MQDVLPLVTPEYVAAMTGADVTADPARTALLIDEASQLVCEAIPRYYTPETAPAAVRQAVAILVASALESPAGGGGTGGDAAIKSEQIGDYRVEYAGAGSYTSGLDVRRVDYLLEPLRTHGYSIVTDVPLDGVPVGMPPVWAVPLR